MPYIDDEALKQIFDASLEQMGRTRLNSGELSCFITKVLNKQKAKCFEDYALLVGVTVLTLLEYWRRLIVPYEESKKKRNGDVYL